MPSAIISREGVTVCASANIKSNRNASVDDSQTFPFVCDVHYGHAAAYAGNLAVSGSVAAIRARITAGEGDALSFQVGCDVDPGAACLTVSVDGGTARVELPPRSVALIQFTLPTD